MFDSAEYTDHIFAGGLDSPYECPGYGIKQSLRNSEYPFQGQLWFGVEALDRVLSISQIELFGI